MSLEYEISSLVLPLDLNVKYAPSGTSAKNRTIKKLRVMIFERAALALDFEASKTPRGLVPPKRCTIASTSSLSAAVCSALTP